MFESDDFDQILSQFDFPGVSSEKPPENVNYDCSKKKENLSHIETLCETTVIKPCRLQQDETINKQSKLSYSHVSTTQQNSSKTHLKRKIIDSYFDHKSKRKFPGPAGLLSSSYKENLDENVCEMELLSQDIDFSQNCLQKNVFDLPLWNRLLEDLRDWNLGSVDSTKAIKECTLTGNFRKRKAQTVAAFIESIDRSIIDPLITLRDSTGTIKCTLHRDAWSKFSAYIASEYCALVLWKPTILTTGGAFKKHYLNITLSNICAIYSSAVLEESSNELPEGFVINNEGEFTVIKTDVSSLKSGINTSIELISDTNGLLDGLDNIFSEEEF